MAPVVGELHGVRGLSTMKPTTRSVIATDVATGSCAMSHAGTYHQGDSLLVMFRPRTRTNITFG